MRPRRSRTTSVLRLALVGAAGAMTVASLATTATSTPGPDADPSARTSAAAGTDGRIAYTKGWRVAGRGGRDIFTVRPDGEDGRRLTYSRNATTPLWSPTGERIAFQRGRRAWVMDGDGSDKSALTGGRLVGWMPDGDRVLVVRGLGTDAYQEQNPAWWLHTISTGEQERLPIELPLVAGLAPPYDDDDEWSYAADPALSPDGEQLALTMWRYDNDWNSGYDYWHGSVFTVRLDGTGLTRISGYSYSTYDRPAWSPDSRELVYSWEEPRSHCLGGLSSVRVDGVPGSVDVDGPSCRETDPGWSPDGRKLLYSVGGERLVVARPDGSRARTLLPAREGVRRTQPDWGSLG